VLGNGNGDGYELCTIITRSLIDRRCGSGGTEVITQAFRSIPVGADVLIRVLNYSRLSRIWNY
jgi:hypothetical protein